MAREHRARPDAGAKAAGIKQVIVPARNKKDMQDIPAEVKNSLQFHFVENVDQALEVSLGPPGKASKAGGRRSNTEDVSAS